MTPDEIKSSITGWCNYGSGLQLVEDRSQPGGDFALGIRAATHGSAEAVPLEIRHDRAAERVTVSSMAASSVGAEEARKLFDSRPASVRSESQGGNTVISGHVYTDGFNRNAFMRTVEEVAKTSALLGALGGGAAAAGAQARGGDQLGGQPAAAQGTRQEPWAAATPTPQPSSFPTPASTLPTPSFGGSPAGQPGGQQGYNAPLSGQPAPQAQPASAGFAPTHTVPPQGMQAWAAPDPNGAVVATLGGGLPVQITEVRGAWARVLCSNGWSGWVDGRIIGVAR